MAGPHGPESSRNSATCCSSPTRRWTHSPTAESFCSVRAERCLGGSGRRWPAASHASTAAATRPRPHLATVIQSLKWWSPSESPWTEPIRSLSSCRSSTRNPGSWADYHPILRHREASLSTSSTRRRHRPIRHRSASSKGRSPSLDRRRPTCRRCVTARSRSSATSRYSTNAKLKFEPKTNDERSEQPLHWRSASNLPSVRIPVTAKVFVSIREMVLHWAKDRRREIKYVKSKNELCWTPQWSPSFWWISLDQAHRITKVHSPFSSKESEYLRWLLQENKFYLCCPVGP